MENSCVKCNTAIVGIERVACRGFCGGSFHMNCAGVSRALLGYFTSHRKNLYWMCDKCAELFENSHFRAITSSPNEPSPLASLTQAIAELRTEIKQLASKPKVSTPSPTIDGWPSLGLARPAKRPRLLEHNHRSDEMCMVGSKTPRQDVVSVPTYSVSKKFWLYLSRIQPDVSDEAVLNMVKSNMNLTENPDVIRLVPKGKDVSSLTFISFKIGLDPTMQSLALDPTTWPEGIMFRRFEDYGIQKFRKPSSVNGPPKLTTPGTDATPTSFSINLTPNCGSRDAL